MPDAKNIVQWLLDLFPGVLALFAVVLLGMLIPALLPLQNLVLLALVVLDVLFFSFNMLPGFVVVLFFVLAKIPLEFLIALLVLAWLLPKVKLG